MRRAQREQRQEFLNRLIAQDSPRYQWSKWKRTAQRKAVPDHDPSTLSLFIPLLRCFRAFLKETQGTAHFSTRDSFQRLDLRRQSVASTNAPLGQPEGYGLQPVHHLTTMLRGFSPRGKTSLNSPIPNVYGVFFLIPAATHPSRALTAQPPPLSLRRSPQRNCAGSPVRKK
jgi:hypothetical protein